MKNNKVIAEFMGVNVITLDDVRKNKNPYFSSADGYLEDDLKYHTSWDWLIPVVDKCFQYGELHNSYREQIIASLSGVIDIEDTYKAVVEFINEYNKTI
jgi:hypothetical protein